MKLKRGQYATNSRLPSIRNDGGLRVGFRGLLTICRMRRPQRQLHFRPGPGPGPGPIFMRPSEPTGSADPTRVYHGLLRFFYQVRHENALMLQRKPVPMSQVLFKVLQIMEGRLTCDLSYRSCCLAAFPTGNFVDVLSPCRSLRVVPLLLSSYRVLVNLRVFLFFFFLKRRRQERMRMQLRLVQHKR